MERSRVWIIPPLIFLSLFLLIPSAAVMVNALSEGLGGFLSALGKGYVMRAFNFSFTQALLSAALSLLVGYPAGYLVARYEFKGRRSLRSLSLIPFAVPSIVVVVGFTVLYGYASPLVRLIPPLKALGEGFSGVLAAHVFYNAPLVLHVVSSSLERLDPELEEAAEVLGDTPFRRFLRVELPHTLHAVTSSFLLVFLYCFTSFAIPLVIGGVSYRTVEVEIYSNYKVYINYQAAASLSLAQLAVLVTVALLYSKTTLEKTALIPPGYGEETKRRGMSGVLRFLAPPYLALLTAFLAAPLVATWVSSLVDPYTGRVNLGVLARLVSGRVDPALGVPFYLSVLNSLFYSSLGALLALGLAFSAEVSGSPRWLVSTLTMTPLAVSPAILALGLHRVYREFPLFEEAGWLLIVSSYAVMALPLALNVVDVGFSRLPPELVEAAYTLGDDWLDALVKVKIPLASSAIVSALALSLSVGLGEFTATLLLLKPEYTTMTVAVYKLLGARRFQEAALVSSLLTLVDGALFWAAQRWSR